MTELLEIEDLRPAPDPLATLIAQALAAICDAAGYGGDRRSQVRKR